jgi:transketolase
VKLTEGRDALLFSYGPVMLHEALGAAELLKAEGVGVTVVNMPWLNRVDPEWLAATVDGFERIYTLDDHSPYGALGDLLLNALNDQRRLGSVRFEKIGVREIPACGTPPEVLRHHGVDAGSVADRIRNGR